VGWKHRYRVAMNKVGYLEVESMNGGMEASLYVESPSAFDLPSMRSESHA